MTIEDINALPTAEFAAQFGGLFEHSPWIAEQCAAMRPFADLAAMEGAMTEVVTRSGEQAQLALLRAHPELAGKAAIEHSLTPASATEQSSAGLDALVSDELARFADLNRKYLERFGFPFIICVRLTDKAGILAEMERRLANDEREERSAALAEVGKIARLRLRDMMKVTS